MSLRWKLVIIRTITAASLGYALSVIFPQYKVSGCTVCATFGCSSTSAGYNTCMSSPGSCTESGLCN